MRNRPQVLAIIIFLTMAGILLTGAMSSGMARQVATEESGRERTIHVSGSGRVSARPDIAVVRLGVQTEAEAAAEALSTNSRQMQALIDVMSESGIAQEDIQTQTVRVSPRYEDVPERPGQRELVGYTATNIVEVFVRDIDGVGEILDAAVQAGGNRIEDIRFEVSEPSAYLDQAREAAWNDAEHKAKQLASLAGAELDMVLTINESGASPQPAVEQFARVETAAAVPIEAGSQTIVVNLQVSWSLKETE